MPSIPFVEWHTRNAERLSAIGDLFLSDELRAACADLDSHLLQTFEPWIDRVAIPCGIYRRVMNEVEPLEVEAAFALRRHRARVDSEQSVLDAFSNLRRAVIRTMSIPTA